MAKGLFLAWLNPVDDDHDAELNVWYDGTHIAEVRAAIPSITAVHRYRTAGLPGGQQPAHRYLAVYEMDSADIAAAAQALAAAGSEGRMQMTDAIDYASAPPVIHWYQGLEG